MLEAKFGFSIMLQNSIKCILDVDPKTKEVFAHNPPEYENERHEVKPIKLLEICCPRCGFSCAETLDEMKESPYLEVEYI
jgi:hypothetical protein